MYTLTANLSLSQDVISLNCAAIIDNTAYIPTKMRQMQ